MRADTAEGLLHGPSWHNERRKRLLEAHPEVKALVGRNPWTSLVVVGLVAGQLALAWWAGHQSWWVLGLAVYFVGVVIAHALGVLVHELGHDLVFESAALNKALSILANMPLVFPAAIDFRGKHLEHHAHLGEPDGPDTQAPQAWEFGFVRSRLRAVIWLCFGPMMVHRDQGTKPSAWLFANFLFHALVLVPFTYFAGFPALVYLGLSGWLAFGVHPVGIRRYAEHLAMSKDQPTTSYYGPFNLLAFNVGYHVEHHDLPHVPWTRVRRLRRIAPEFYQPLHTISSWSALLWRLLTRPDEGPWRYYLERPSKGLADAPPEGRSASLRAAS